MLTATDDNAVDFLRRLSVAHKRADSQARKSRARSFGNDAFFAGTWTTPGGFGGAVIDRTTEEWMPGNPGPNRLHQMNGQLLRERARDLAENNPHAAAAIDAYLANVIECGITPKPKFEDSERRALWARAWERFGGLTPAGGNEADVTGFGTIYDMQALHLREVLVGGGCLLHFTELPKSRDRSLPLSVEMIPEERITDERDNFAFPIARGKKTQNPIVRGVEINPATGRPVAYWIRPSMPNDVAPEELEPIRLDAQDCEYGFFRRRIGQYRGTTLLRAIVMFLWRLGYYLDNEMLASQMKSAWGYMVLSDADANLDFADLNDSDPESGATDAYGNLIEKIEPGMVWRGKVGDKIQAVGPNVPGSDSLPWIKLIEQSIAMGAGLSSAELTRDYSDINFSAARAAMQQDRKRYRPMQRFSVTTFGNPIWRRFATIAAREGIDGFPTQSDFLSNLNDWLAVSWRAPGWESVNPLDDARADEIYVKLRTRSRMQIIAREGGDEDETFEQIDREEQKLDDLGLLEPVEAAAGDEKSPDTSAARDSQNKQKASAKKGGRR